MDSNFCPGSGKQMFLTHYQAERVLRGLNLRTHTGLDYGSIYRCTFCHHWHITHYGYEERDSLNSTRGKPPNKKILRSERNREKKHRREKQQLRPVFYDMITHKLKVLMPGGIDLHTAATRVSEAAGQVKTFCAAPNAIAQLLMIDAFQQLTRKRLIRHEGKRLFALAMEHLKTYQQRLVSSPLTPMSLFDVQTMSEQYRSRYQKDLTTQQYVEFWEGVGGQVYDVIKPQLKVLTHKYERYYDRVGHPFPHEMALAHLADTMLSMAAGTYRTVIQYCARYVPPLSMPLEQVLSQCDMSEVSKAWNRACQYIDCAGHPTEEEERNAELTTVDIIQVLSDPEQTITYAQNAIRDFGTEVFASKAEIKAALRRNQDLINDCKKDRIDQQRRKLEEKNN